MCGIAGIYNYTSNTPIDESVLIDMRDTMVHRGPDGAGIWLSPNRTVGLAHRRLSIIDLATSASQPMSNEDGTVWVTFNGEIYNHLELRGQLQKAGHIFRTEHSDTETLVHGLEEWGIEGLLERLAGDYGVALWDQKNETLHLIRDRIGVKPVYFSFVEGVLIFASEIKALLKYPGIRREVDPQAMFHYLSFMTTPAPMTMFSGIYKLPAGYCLSIKRGDQVLAKRYWDAVPGQAIPHNETANLSDVAREEFYIKGIKDRLHSSVERRMMSDVPFGVFLSGGIDSSTNVALMSQFMDRPVDTFTVGFKDYQHLNELEQAKLVSKRFNTNHHEVLIEESDMLGYLEQMIHSQDEPIADWVCIPLYFVSKLARDSGTTVVQVGEGSDEQFCGYSGYMMYRELYKKYWNPFKSYIPQFLQHGVAEAAKMAAHIRPSLLPYADVIDRAARNREHFWCGSMVFWDLMKKKLLDPNYFPAPKIAPEMIECGLLSQSYLEPDSFNVIKSFFDPFDAAYPNSDPLTRMIYSEFKLRLPELLLMRVDKIGMSTTIEARVPFLDHELVEFTMDIPERDKIRNQDPKYLLKKAVRGLIPDEIIDRKKMGFGAPMAQWMRGPFGLRVQDSIMRSPLIDRLGFDSAFIREMCSNHISGRSDYSVFIWTLFNLVEWHRYWVERED